MTDRILDLSETKAYLRVQNAQLKIQRDEQETVSVPLAEIAVIILAHPQVTCTLAVLAGLLDQGGAIVACNQQHLPVGLMLPTNGHFTQTERFTAQANASVPTQKRLWQQIVKAKIRSQAALLNDLRGNDFGLADLAKTTRSGDPANVEAQAARRYWPALFDDDQFRRRRDADDQNRMLNYGYAVLRALVGRAICAVGLHPSLGLHHHNRYNAFCLADDLMEPFRPVIDAAVVEHVGEHGKDAPLNRAAKQAILETIGDRYRVEGESRTLFDLVARTASSLAKVYMKEENRLFFPEVLGHGEG